MFKKFPVHFRTLLAMTRLLIHVDLSSRIFCNHCIVLHKILFVHQHFSLFFFENFFKKVICVPGGMKFHGGWNFMWHRVKWVTISAGSPGRRRLLNGVTDPVSGLSKCIEKIWEDSDIRICTDNDIDLYAMLFWSRISQTPLMKLLHRITGQPMVMWPLTRFHHWL